MSKIFVGNLPHAAIDDNLKAWVEEHGFAVECAEIIRDRSTGHSRGFGFVTLQESWREGEAISALNGKRMEGRILTVNKAVPLPTALPRVPRKIAS